MFPFPWTVEAKLYDVLKQLLTTVIVLFRKDPVLVNGLFGSEGKAEQCMNETNPSEVLKRCECLYCAHI